MKKLGLFLSTVLLIFSLLFSTSYAENKGTLIDKLKTIKTFEADFVQINQLQGFGEDKYIGKVYIKMKEIALWDYKSPFKSWYLIDNKKLENYDEINNQLLRINSDEIKDHVLLQILTNIDIVTQNFKAKQKDSKTVELYPIKNNVPVKKINILFENDMISKIISIDNSGNVTTFSFNNIIIDKNIPNKVFKKKLPKNVTVFEPDK